MQAMAANGTLTKTRDLVTFIEAAGHDISGENKVNALGALLARSADIVGHGKSGWELADREKALAIINRYLVPKENEASPAQPEDASEAGDAGVQPPSAPPVISPPWQRA